MAKKITSLYINDKSIRLMVTHGKRISKLADVPLDIDLENVSDEDKQMELVEKIRHLFSANKIGPTRFIFGMSGLHSLSRPVILPLLPKAMQEEAMTREAKRLLPVPPEQLHISWQIVSSDESRMRAFIVAMPRQTTDYLLHTLDQAGLRPYLMDIKPLALARLIKEETAMLIDVQETEFDIVIMSDGFPQPMRTLSFPHDSLSYQEKLAIVKDELRRTVQFYNSNNPEKLLPEDTTIYISGEMAENPDSFESLSRELGYNITPLTSPLKCPKQLDPSHYLVNVGLTLKELPRESGSLLANINTLPGHYLPKPISRDRLLAIPAVIVAVAVVTAFVFVIQNTTGNINATNEQVAANKFIITKKQTEKQTLLKEIEILNGQIADLEIKNDSFTITHDAISSLSNELNADINAIVDNVVSGVTLRNITHSGNTISIMGLAPTEEEILEYARELDKTGRYDEIVVTKIQESNDDDGADAQGYHLTLKLRGTE
jgi:type IV pilus assembly protein PilM